MGRPPTINRQHLLDSARRIFASKGFAATTLAEIAGELHVTPAAILRHAASKEALFLSAMESGEIVQPPQCILDLATTDAHDDPRMVLRSVAEGFIPFIQGMIGARLVMAMHANSYRTSLTLPFNAAGDDSPPRLAFRIVVDYFDRAAAAGVIKVPNPAAAALLFIGSLQGFVLTQTVLKVGPPVAVNEYIDALIDLWCAGAIVGGSNARKKKPVDPSRGRARGARDRDRGHASVHAPATAAAPARAGGNARGANSKRRLARGRPRRPRLRR
ncbi:MAG: TetR/AcrR family transcriptional regulator [Thermoanaerobaculia bacterium]